MIEVVHDYLYIGDLSREDADVLAHYSRSATAICEFGVGASTQIFAQCDPDTTRLSSLDTSPEWILRTQEALRALGIARPVEFVPYEDLRTITGNFDLVFDDGHERYRLPFARHAWSNLLQTDGWLLFHDTRRASDYGNVVNLLADCTAEIRQVLFNVHESNITAVQKRAPLAYVNWNSSEGRTGWERGNPKHARPPGFREYLMRRQLDE